MDAKQDYAPPAGAPSVHSAAQLMRAICCSKMLTCCASGMSQQAHSISSFNKTVFGSKMKDDAFNRRDAQMSFTLLLLIHTF